MLSLGSYLCYLLLTTHYSLLATHHYRYAMLSLGSYLCGTSLIASVCVSPRLPKMGVQTIIIDKMFKNDVSIYLVFNFAFISNFFLAMYISLPFSASSEAQRGAIVQGKIPNVYSMSEPVRRQSQPTWYTTH
jgi:hypothetical protein